MNPMKTFANLISALFHPLLMLTYGLSLVLFCSYLSAYSLVLRGIILANTFLITTLVPSLLIYLLIRAKVVSNAELTNRKERFIPYSIFILAYLICILYLYRIHMPFWVIASVAGACLALIVAMGINSFWKISAHSIGIGGLVGEAIGLSHILRIDITGIIIFLIFIAGLVGASRLYLGRHTPMQVYAGFTLGFLSVFSILCCIRLYTVC
jgi:membrane-associated phospholipid phosphatase